MPGRFAKRRCLVTGAAGFIGSHLVEALLDADADVRAFIHYNSRRDIGYLIDAESNKRLEIVAGDIADPFAVNRAAAGCDYIFHLAALIGIPYSYHAPASYVETNIRGTLHVLEAAAKHKPARVLITSTSEVYGSGREFPMSEEHPLNAQSPYAATKVAADQLALSYAASFGSPVVVVRPFNTYAPSQSRRAVIPAILSQVVQAEQAGLPADQPVKIDLGDLRPKRDFVYVHDTAQGFLAAALAPEEHEWAPILGQVFNLASGSSISIEDLITRLEGVTGRTIEVATQDERKRPPASEVWHLEGDASKAQSRLKWRPEVTLFDGLAQTLEWYRTHPPSAAEARSYQV